MANINLLPWREELREEQKKQFFVSLAISVIFGLSVWGGIHFAFAQIINDQKEVNNILNKEIKILNKKIRKIKKLKKEKESLLARMSIIEELQTSRPLAVKIFDEIVEVIPEGVVINKVTRKQDKLNVAGVAESNTLVSRLMRNIEAAQWLEKSKLSEIKHGKKNQKESKVFKLSMHIKKPKRMSEDSMDDDF